MSDSVSAGRVTILLPTYNAGRYLRERLDTIMSQTMTDWHLVVYDSYSTDDTLSILSEYQSDPRVELLQGPKEGIYKAWNALRQHVRGEYCCIATADDTMSPEFLARGVEALENYGEAAAFACPIVFIGENSQPLDFQIKNHAAAYFLNPAQAEPVIRSGTDDALLHLALDMMYISITALLFRATDFMANGPFRTDLGSTGDREWTMRFLVGRKVIYFGQPLATWRIHSQQASAGLDNGAELQLRVGYEDDLITDGVRRGFWNPGLRAAWRKTAARRSFLLRAEYRARTRGWRELRDLATLVLMHPRETIRWLLSMLRGVNYCRECRIELGTRYLAAASVRSGRTGEKE